MSVEICKEQGKLQNPLELNLEKWEEASTKASIVIAIDCTMHILFTNCNQRVKMLNLFTTNKDI
jgi:hypothetical protein